MRYLTRPFVLASELLPEDLPSIPPWLLGQVDDHFAVAREGDIPRPRGEVERVIALKREGTQAEAEEGRGRERAFKLLPNRPFTLEHLPRGCNLYFPYK